MSNTLRDLLADKTAPLFVNRKRELEVFQNLISHDSNYLILLMTGPGGIGKSTLLSQLSRLAKLQEIPVAYTNLQFGVTPIVILQNWWDQLGLPQSSDFLDFIEDSKSLYRGVATTSTSAEDILVPSGGPVRIQQESSDTYRHLIHQITKSFVREANNILAEQLAVLMLDTFELANQDLEVWLVEELISSLSTNFRLAIAGRNVREEIWSSWMPVMTHLELGGLTQDEVKEYLGRIGLETSNMTDSVFQYTQGLPLALAIVAENLVASETQDFNLEHFNQHSVQDITIDRFFRYLPDERMRLIIEAAAILREFNIDSLSEVSGETVTREVFEKLLNFAFIRSSSSGYTIHDTVRKFIIEYLENNSPSRLLDLKVKAIKSGLTSNELRIIEYIGQLKAATVSEIAVELQILESEVEKTLESFVSNQIIKENGSTQDGETILVPTDFGLSLLDLKVR